MRETPMLLPLTLITVALVVLALAGYLIAIAWAFCCSMMKCSNC